MDWVYLHRCKEKKSARIKKPWEEFGCTYCGCKDYCEAISHNWVHDQNSKVGGTSTAGVKKKFFTSEFQLVFEFVNKVLLPILEKRTIPSGVDLFLIECLSKIWIDKLICPYDWAHKKSNLWFKKNMGCHMGNS